MSFYSFKSKRHFLDSRILRDELPAEGYRSRGNDGEEVLKRRKDAKRFAIYLLVFKIKLDYILLF
jgi:hypothetical protein